MWFKHTYTHRLCLSYTYTHTHTCTPTYMHIAHAHQTQSQSCEAVWKYVCVWECACECVSVCVWTSTTTLHPTKQQTKQFYAQNKFNHFAWFPRSPHRTIASILHALIKYFFDETPLLSNKLQFIFVLYWKKKTRNSCTDSYHTHTHTNTHHTSPVFVDSSYWSLCINAIFSIIHNILTK